MKRLFSVVILSSLSLMLFGGCATLNSNIEPEFVPLSLAEANAVVAELEQRQRDNLGGDRLLNPSNLDDVFSILRSDNIGLFGAGVQLAATLTEQHGLQAMALHGQSELAWGEAQLVLAELLENMATQVADTVAELESLEEDSLSPDDRARRDNLRSSIESNERAAQALVRIASEHIAKGSAVADRIIELYPDNYLGYRIAADFYRLNMDWNHFRVMIDKIRERNPDSNGLRFQLGLAAKQFDNDLPTARGFLGEALANDPKFTRARVQLMLAQSSVQGLYDRFQDMTKSNPQHQIVALGTDAIERTYQIWLKEQAEADAQEKAEAEAAAAAAAAAASETEVSADDADATGDDAEEAEEGEPATE